MEERTCKTCGKTLPIEKFPKAGKYYKYECKSCCNERLRRWREEKKSQTGKPYPSLISQQSREKRILREAVKRVKRKEVTGTTYRNETDAEHKRAYQREYERTHRHNPKRKEAHNRGSRNYYHRQRMKEEVTLLDEFFNSGFLD